jgi:glycosyltransferase involved in cell wall biosynthesis
VEGRANTWWSNAARLEPERRVRFTGPVSREEFALLLGLTDFLVLPGQTERPTSHALVEALAGGVLALGTAPAGGESAARLIADEVSREIGSLCVLRGESPAVREIEAKLGRLVRLRPDVADRLRALAVRKFDGRQTAADLRRLYGEPSARA